MPGELDMAKQRGLCARLHTGLWSMRGYGGSGVPLESDTRLYAEQGGTVQLYYFPPGLAHPATGPVMATTLGTTFTSPTYYISMASAYASDACSEWDQQPRYIVILMQCAHDLQVVSVQLSPLRSSQYPQACR